MPSLADESIIVELAAASAGAGFADAPEGIDAPVAGPPFPARAAACDASLDASTACSEAFLAASAADCALRDALSASVAACRSFDAAGGAAESDSSADRALGTVVAREAGAGRIVAHSRCGSRIACRPLTPALKIGFANSEVAASDEGDQGKEDQPTMAKTRFCWLADRLMRH